MTTVPGKILSSVLDYPVLEKTLIPLSMPIPVQSLNSQTMSLLLFFVQVS